MKKIFCLLLTCLLLTAALSVAVSAGAIPGFTPVDILKTSQAPVIDGKYDPNEGWGTPIRSLSGYEECLKYCYDAGDFSDPADYTAWIADPAHIPSALDVYVRWDDTRFYYCAVEKLATRTTGDWYSTDLWMADSIICSCTLEDDNDDMRSRWNWSILDDGTQEFTIYDGDPFVVDLENIAETCRASRDEETQTTVYEMSAPWENLLDPADFTPKLGGIFRFRDLLIPVTSDTTVGDPVDLVPASTEGKYYWKMTLVDEEGNGAPVVMTPEGYPSSGFTPKEGSAILTGQVIGLELGWDGTAACGCTAAFDGDPKTFFDPLGTGDGWAGIDAGGEYTLTSILIHPRTDWLDRFSGGTIEGSMDPEFENAVEIWSSVEAAPALEWQIIDQSDFDEVGSFRYYRYINYTNHGDVGDVELYGYPSDGEYEAQEAARQEAAKKAEEEAAAKKAEAEAAKAAEEAAKAAEEAAKAAEEAAKAAEEAAAQAAEEVVEAAEGAADSAAEAVEEAKKGCGSFVGGGLVVLVTVLGSAWMARRRD